MDPNDLISELLGTFEQAHKEAKFTTKRKHNFRKNNFWMTQDLLDKTKIRDKLFKKWKNCNANNPLKQLRREEYDNFRNKLNKSIHRAKHKYYRTSIERSRGNLKDIWNKIDELLEEVGSSL